MMPLCFPKLGLFVIAILGFLSAQGIADAEVQDANVRRSPSNWFRWYELSIHFFFLSAERISLIFRLHLDKTSTDTENVTRLVERGNSGDKHWNYFGGFFRGHFLEGYNKGQKNHNAHGSQNRHGNHKGHEDHN